MTSPAQHATAKRSIRDLPGPRAWPLVGNLLSLRGERNLLQLETWSERYGRLYRVMWGTTPALVVADPQLSASILRARPQSVRRIDRIEPLFAELGAAGVFSAEGDAWRAQRKLSMEALSQSHVRSYYPTLRTVAERLLERWQQAAVTGGARDIQDDLMRFTVDVTTTLTFGVDVNTLSGGEDVLQRHLAEIFPAISRRMVSPLPYWRLFKLPQDYRVERARSALHRLQSQLIAAAREHLARNPQQRPRNFLEAMLLARDDRGQPFSDEVIHGNMLTMLLAGEDTTANTLAWAIHYLGTHPEVARRARAEVDAALGETLTPADLVTANKLPYLDAIAQETMRLRPAAPLQGTQTIEPLTVEDIAVPAGSYIILLGRVPGLDADNFAEPEAFAPERWLAPHGPAHNPQAIMPFGSGPRLCPGRALALLEMRVVLATFLRSFDVEHVTPAHAVRERLAFTMSPTNLSVRVRSRYRKRRAQQVRDSELVPLFPELS